MRRTLDFYRVCNRGQPDRCETIALQAASTRERGLRQALGAKTRDILTQFLVEAVTLSIVGGFAGIVFGIGASLLISQLAGWATAVGPGAVMLAVFFSALVGIGFGYYPARKAAYLDPIEALRSE